MDYLLTSGVKFCPIKLLARAGRARLRGRPSKAFPKTMQFRCPKRPVPTERYQVRLRGIGVADITILAVSGSDIARRFHVLAELTTLQSHINDPPEPQE